jgi:hypothetical protein
VWLACRKQACCCASIHTPFQVRREWFSYAPRCLGNGWAKARKSAGAPVGSADYVRNTAKQPFTLGSHPACVNTDHPCLPWVLKLDRECITKHAHGTTTKGRDCERPGQNCERGSPGNNTQKQPRLVWCAYITTHITHEKGWAGTRK